MPPGTAASASPAPKLPTVRGRVIHGDKVGRTIGFPTANLDVNLDPDQLKPGVYAAWVRVGESSEDVPALAYFGPRFIFGEKRNSFEVFLMDFSGDLYDQSLTVELLAHRRGPLPFTSLQELQRQLELDTEDGLTFFANMRTIAS